MDDKFKFFIFLLGGVTASIITFVVVDDAYKHRAVAHHAAEYYLDANNNRQWHWLDTPKKP